jgi:hypothetical protein
MIIICVGHITIEQIRNVTKRVILIDIPVFVNRAIHELCGVDRGTSRDSAVLKPLVFMRVQTENFMRVNLARIHPVHSRR